MPAVERSIAPGAPVRPTRQHWWRGAGIAKEAGVHPPIEANPPGLSLSLARGEGGVAVTMENARAGHMLPTGDPERWVQVDVRFESADGAPVGDTARFRFGQTWEWEPTPRKTGDTRLAPLESRVEEVAIPAGAATAHAVASSHRMTEDNARYHHLLPDYPIAVETHHEVLRVAP